MTCLCVEVLQIASNVYSSIAEMQQLLIRATETRPSSQGSPAVLQTGFWKEVPVPDFLCKSFVLQYSYKPGVRFSAASVDARLRPNSRVPGRNE